MTTESSQRLAGVSGSLRLSRRRLLGLGAGMALGVVDGLPDRYWWLPAAEPSWLVFVSERDAGRGFVVRDDAQGGFASAYRQLGGSRIAGLAMSSRFREVPDGPIQQICERLVLQAASGAQSVRPAPLLAVASERGFDDQLKRLYGIPEPLGGSASEPQVGDDFRTPYELLGAEDALGAPTSRAMRWRAGAYQRFENAVIAVHRPGRDDQTAELVPVPVYLRAAGYFLEAPFVPRALPVGRMPAPPIVRQGDTSQPYVFITIDDCWDAELTTRCLDVARSERVKLTFFPVGAVIHESPSLWRRVVDEGHSIENHSQLHLPLSELSDGRIRWEIEEAGRQLNAALGFPYRQRFFRPPQGAGILDYQGRIVGITRATRMHVAMWTVDSKGWLYPRDDSVRAQDFVLGNLARKMEPGAILLMHALASDVAALPRLVRSIHSAGLQSLRLRDQLTSPDDAVSRGQQPPACEDPLYDDPC